MMFTTRHYREVATILHKSRNAAIREGYIDFWYDEVYTPFVKLFEADNPRFNSLVFSWAVATGDVSRVPPRKKVTA